MIDINVKSRWVDRLASDAIEAVLIADTVKRKVRFVTSRGYEMTIRPGDDPELIAAKAAYHDARAFADADGYDFQSNLEEMAGREHVPHDPRLDALPNTAREYGECESAEEQMALTDEVVARLKQGAVDHIGGDK